MSISYLSAPLISENSMSIRVPIELTRICGASDGHEIPSGSMGGKNAWAAEAGVADTIALVLATDVASGESGDEPAQPTMRLLANMRSTDENFISGPFYRVFGEPNALSARKKSKSWGH